MKNLFRVTIWLVLALSVVSCGQIDPIALTGKLKGRNAERLSLALARHMGIRTGDHRVKVTHNIMVEMRDGMLLATDVYEPLPEGKYPCVTCRLPYEKKNMVPIGYIMASNGYVFAVQDTRATGESQGTNFFPVISDYSDGHDMIKWVKTQPWYNGKIGAWGASFLGRTQWLVSDSPDMTCIYPQFTSTDFAGGHRGGANLHEGPVTWAARTGHHGSRIEGKSRKEVDEMIRERVMTTGYYNDPLDKPWVIKPPELVGLDLDGILGLMSRKFGEKLSWVGPPYSEDVLLKMRDLLFTPGIAEATMGYSDPLDRFREMKSPALLISGWYDVHLAATMQDFSDIKKYAVGAPRDGSRIVVGPWAHIMTGGRDVPKRGPNASGRNQVFQSLFIFEWWDYWLKGVDSEYMNTPPVKIYVMGINQWRYENEWPLARTKWTEYYIDSNGSPNSPGGEGYLSTWPPTMMPPDEFDYNPHDPAPTMGGNKLLRPSGAMDQREVETRPDVLVYTSEPLKEDLEVTGPLKAVIYASSSAVDTDFTVKLVDVFPDGKAVNINDGIIRARYRNGLDAPSLIVPGEIYRYEIDMWATSNVFLKGHRIRVEISSSNFPRYDRNSNLGGAEGEPVVARQKIYHDREHPSHVILPVIP